MHLHQQLLEHMPRPSAWVARTAEALEPAIESFHQDWSHAPDVPEPRLARRLGGTETCRVLYLVDQLDLDNARLGFNGWRRIRGLG